MAAGKGTRFGDRTAAMPKGFIQFNGRPMIERSIENLLSVGIRDIIIGTGYHKEWYEALQEKYSQIKTVFSPEFANTNSMETLYRCRTAVAGRDFLLLESDIVYDPKALECLLTDSHEDIMLASEITKFQDQYYIAVDKDFNLLMCSTDKDKLIKETGEKPYGELVGIHKISDCFYQRMIEDYETHRKDNLKRGYEFEIEDIATGCHSNGTIKAQPIDRTHLCHIQERGMVPMYVLKLADLQWYEIDDLEDLAFAEKHVKIA